MKDVDEARLHELLGKLVTELGAAFVGASPTWGSACCGVWVKS
jgi:hypothetical protein